MNNQSRTDAAGAPVGRFGAYGGRYVPEALMAALEQLDEARLKAKVDPALTSARRWVASSRWRWNRLAEAAFPRSRYPA